MGTGYAVLDESRAIDPGDLTPALAQTSGFASVPEYVTVAKHRLAEKAYPVEFPCEPATGSIDLIGTRDDRVWNEPERPRHVALRFNEASAGPSRRALSAEAVGSNRASSQGQWSAMPRTCDVGAVPSARRARSKSLWRNRQFTYTYSGCSRHRVGGGAGGRSLRCFAGTQRA